MPFVRISLRRGKPKAHLRAVADAVHQALVDTFDIPVADRFQAIDQYEPEELIFDRDYLGGPRSEDFLLVCVTSGKDRSASTKQKFYRRLAETLTTSIGLRPQDLMVIVYSTEIGDWSFSDGVAAAAAINGDIP